MVKKIVTFEAVEWKKKKKKVIFENISLQSIKATFPKIQLTEVNYLITMIFTETINSVSLLHLCNSMHLRREKYVPDSSQEQLNPGPAQPRVNKRIM